MELTSEQVMEVPCIICDAKPGCRCSDVVSREMVLLGFHNERVELRKKLPAIGGELNETDKSLIVLYAYVIICDSVSSKSETLFGRHLTSIEIQRFFGAKAVEELKRDGLLK